MSLERLKDVTFGNGSNYIFPFFWQHGEDDTVLREEIRAIYSSGISAVCVESRPHPDFGGESWWRTMDVILDECEKHGMRVWLLDDAKFPSGGGNGIIPKKYPHLRPIGITERHLDVIGPLKDASVMSDWKKSPEEELVGVFACERVRGSVELTGNIIDLTDRLGDGMVYFDIPDGCYRIVFLIKTDSGFWDYLKDYCDKLSSESMDKFIEAVYEPHYEHYGDKFGRVFAGFFSDEPCFGTGTEKVEEPDRERMYTAFPWHDDLLPILREKLGDGYFSMLPSLWFPTKDETMRKTRVAYMDAISALYKRNFTEKIGAWCRSHGCEYIGHVVEDAQRHLTTKWGTAHYFRSLDGQDMAGIDVVLDQVVPGMTDDTITVPCDYDVSDPDFFHFTLAKLGSSHAHIQKLKKGRAMCEIYGAYGWAEGLKTMKWLTDFMLVRGINHFVPHAFSPKFPDNDCPPHFYARGNNPEYRKFRQLCEYMNRVCHLLNGGVHRSSAAVFYQAEPAWCGGRHSRTDKTARYLTENHIDFDIVPSDYLENAEIRDGRLVLAEEEYPCLIMPYSEFLPRKVFENVKLLSEKGLTVIFENALPDDFCEGGMGDDDRAESDSFFAVPAEKTEKVVRKNGWSDVTLSENGETTRFLRFYHYSHGGTELYYVTNENIFKTVKTDVTFSAFGGGEYLIYDPMSNKTERAESESGTISLEIEPYTSVMFIFGDRDGFDDAAVYEKKSRTVSGEVTPKPVWTVEICEEQEYPNYKHFTETEELFNITGRGKLPYFSGHIRYTASVDCGFAGDADRLILELGRVGEVASVFVNGKPAGDRIAPPYRFDITDLVKRDGENTLTVEVTNHLGYKMRDYLSKYLVFEPSGLLGPVKIIMQNDDV